MTAPARTTPVRKTPAKKPAGARVPQDRKRPATYTPPKGGKEFQGLDGNTYFLPPMTQDAAMDIPGGVTLDLMRDPTNEFALLSMAAHALEAVEMPDDVRTALRDLPTARMLEVIGGWMGESSGSSA